MSTCAMCGVVLTAFNRSIGSGVCAACARGTSPEAQQKALFALFARDPSMTEDALFGRSLSQSAPVLIGGGVLAEFIYFAGTLVAGEMSGGKGGVLAPMLAFAAGYGIAGVAVARSRYPLDVVRWRTFANVLAITVAVGVVASLALSFVATMLSLPLGLAFGLAAVRLTDVSRQEALRGKFQEYQATRAGAAPGAHHVLVRGADGYEYPGVVVGAASGQVHVAFPNGSSSWVAETQVRRAS